MTFKLVVSSNLSHVFMSMQWTIYTHQIQIHHLIHVQQQTMHTPNLLQINVYFCVFYMYNKKYTADVDCKNSIYTL